jgi:DNA polymerase-3 subunit alpha
VEIIAFPDLYKAAGDLIAPERIVRVTGTVDRGDKGTKLRGSKIEALAELQVKAITKVNIRLGDSPDASSRLPKLQQVLSRHPGSAAVYLTFRMAPHLEADTAPLPNVRVLPSEHFVSEVEEVLGKGAVALLS